MDFSAAYTYEPGAPEVVWQSSQIANLKSLVRKSEAKSLHQLSSSSSASVRTGGKIIRSPSTTSLSSTSTLVSASSSWIDTPGLPKEAPTTSGTSSFSSASRPSRPPRRPKTRASWPEHESQGEVTMGESRQSVESPPITEIPTGPQLELMIKRLGCSLKEKIKATDDPSTVRPKAHKEDAYSHTKRRRTTTSNGSHHTHLEGRLTDRTNNSKSKLLSRTSPMQSGVGLRGSGPSNTSSLPTTPMSIVTECEPTVPSRALNSMRPNNPEHRFLPPLTSTPKSPFSRTKSYPPTHLQGYSLPDPSTATSSQPRQRKPDALDCPAPPISFAQQLVERTSFQRAASSNDNGQPKVAAIPVKPSKNTPRSLGMRIGARTSAQDSSALRNNRFKTPFKAPQPIASPITYPQPPKPTSQDTKMIGTMFKQVEAKATPSLPAPLIQPEVDPDISMASNVGDSSSSFECDLEELDKMMSIYE